MRALLVDVLEIKNGRNHYDLSINKYKKTEYVAVEYPPTNEIMADINGLYKELGGVLSELEGLLNE